LVAEFSANLSPGIAFSHREPLFQGHAAPQSPTESPAEDSGVIASNSIFPSVQYFFTPLKMLMLRGLPNKLLTRISPS